MAISRIFETWGYDGTMAGFLTLVHRAFSRSEFPDVILTPERAMESLFTAGWIETREETAEKIFQRLKQRLTTENFEFFCNGFNSSLATKECCLLDAVEIALQTREPLVNYIGHPAILDLKKSIQSLLHEAHILTGFVRFEYAGDVLVSKIEPKHYSLPYICPHFAERYPRENIVIYDEAHRLLALIEKGSITLLEDMDPPAFTHDAGEEKIQDNWKTFLASVTIRERINYRNQRTHLPLRFRGNMTEFK